MPTKKPSARSSKRSPKSTEHRGDSPFARRLISAAREAAAYARGEISLPARTVRFSAPAPRALRRKLGLSQAQFAARFHFNLRTLQEWEQGRAFPDSAVQAYLTVIDRDPEAVLRSLAATRK